MSTERLSTNIPNGGPFPPAGGRKKNHEMRLELIPQIFGCDMILGSRYPCGIDCEITWKLRRCFTCDHYRTTPKEISQADNTDNTSPASC